MKKNEQETTGKTYYRRVKVSEILTSPLYQRYGKAGMPYNPQATTDEEIWAIYQGLDMVAAFGTQFSEEIIKETVKLMNAEEERK